MLFEGMQRSYDGTDDNEAKRKKFVHIVELMRQHELLENSGMGINWMTDSENQISIYSLSGTYEQLGRLKKKAQQNKKNKKRMLRLFEGSWQP